MSGTEMESSFCELRDGDWSSRAIKACDFIASSCGLGLSTTETGARYYSYGSGIGLKLTYNPSTQMNYSSIGAESIYKNSSGSWVVTSSSNGVGGISSMLSMSDASTAGPALAYLYNKKFEVGSLMANAFKYEDTVDFLYFIPFTATDYFSGKTRTGFFKKDGCYTYNDDTKKIEGMSMQKIALNQRPSDRLLTVAVPVMLSSSTFYGYINDPSSLCEITGVYSSLGHQIQINGVTFTCLYGSIFIR